MLVTNIPIMPTKIELTRERIADAALKLFLERGFSETTVAAIAAEAGVSEMTFFRYFRSKDAVVIDDPYDPVLAEAIARQPRTLPTVTRIASGLKDAWRTLPEPADRRSRDRIRVVAATPVLTGGMWSSNAETERVIVGRLVEDGVDPLEARVAASACLAALMTALLDWAATNDGSLSERIEFAMSVLERS
jgi:AcrR family transcriptional regulator